MIPTPTTGRTLVLLVLAWIGFLASTARAERESFLHKWEADRDLSSFASSTSSSSIVFFEVGLEVDETDSLLYTDDAEALLEALADAFRETDARPTMLQILDVKEGAKDGSVIAVVEADLSCRSGPCLKDASQVSSLRRAYDQDVRLAGLDHVARVQSLDKLEVSSSSSSSKGKGGKKTGKSGKSGKGTKGTKGSSSKTSKKTTSKSGGGTKGKTGKKGKGKGFTCPEQPPVGEFTGEFTSFFAALLQIVLDSDAESLEVGIIALVTAYNRVAELFAADIFLDDAFLFDQRRNRRLTYGEAADLLSSSHHRRRGQELVVGVPTDLVIEVIGFCTQCEQQFTFADQVIDGRRYLEEEELEELAPTFDDDQFIANGCLLPGLPTENQVRLEYNVVLAEIDGTQCDELEEIPRPKGKGKGKGGSSKAAGENTAARRRRRHHRRHR